MGFLTSFVAAIGSGVWSVIAAVLILVVAFVVAAIVKSLVTKLLGKGKVGEFLDKMDTANGEGKAGSTREFIGKLVHLLVFLLFVIKHFVDNYYIIRHNMEVRRSRREQFRKVRSRRRHRRRRRW